LLLALPLPLHKHRIPPNVNEFLCEHAPPDKEAPCIQPVVILRDQKIYIRDVDLTFRKGPDVLLFAVAALKRGVILNGLVHGGVRENEFVEGDGGRHEDGVEVEPPKPLRLGVQLE